MSQLVRLEGKHTYQNAHCAVGCQGGGGSCCKKENIGHILLSIFGKM